jgi:aryl-alcohol dehydrogenase-like predicted oxidoreductase
MMAAVLHTRRLGRTGHPSSIAILGGAAFWPGPSTLAEQRFAEALALGVNHLDIAPSYGEAETAVGPLLEPVRDRWFVGCKTGRKSADGARAQLEESLARLRTDHFDLYQLHAVTSVDVLDERAPAMEAVMQARDEGLTRFVGVTGHDLGAPRAHLEAIRRYDVDTVMFPCYPRVWADPVYRADAEELLAACAARDVGVMVIKAGARRPWGDRTPDHTTWYEPQTTIEGMTRGIRFALSTPGVHAFCTPGDLQVLPLALAAADAYEPLDDEARRTATADSLAEPLIFPLADNVRIR